MTYNLCKKNIETQKRLNKLDKQEMLNKLDVFLLNNRINDAEYNELVKMMEE